MNDAYRSSLFDGIEAGSTQQDSTSPPIGLGALSPLGQAAIEWARAGFAIFPCRPCGKEPLTKHGFKDATRDEAQIRQRWTKWPDANIGLATGRENGIAVIDVDGLEGEKRLALLEEKFGKLPPTSRGDTGNGKHLIFATPEDCGPVPCGAADGLDFRADGGYVIAPPSVHPNGKTYEWDEKSPQQFAEAPEWLLRLAKNWKEEIEALGRRPDALSGPLNHRSASGRRVRSPAIPARTLERNE
jgi:hypothetical protein